VHDMWISLGLDTIHGFGKEAVAIVHWCGDRDDWA
jgi:hypothetical protein